MSQRITLGLAMAAAVVLIALINQFFITFIVFIALLYFTFKEAKKLFNAENASVFPVLIAFIIGTITTKVLLFGIIAFILVLGYLVFIKSENLRLSFIYLYPTLPLFALWQVYVSYGMFVLFWLVLIVAVCDTSAYFIGKKFGTTSFSQSSPNKTLEGVIAGVICASIIGAIFGVFEYNFFFALLCSFCVGVFAIIGDLFESYLKRELGVKDSGTILGEHGGILDRIDALLFASFIMVAFL
ncbi:phosphatidate cytidylyltransferase [Campylobacter sp. MIT 21-1685]|uniref:phosphatidate cytidylyltransferase n=1 Tax=unclassified Campylobacter TaxID=2593542 RepID=UPI00224A9C76|nr:MULTISPECIES: phosphatidate cytidylyltransferase [unclassified Campylobacter]MCX2683508.1 phosphatidate cytidylyltransferase [Campylobacter sp. MIT 21-1684]MCX2751789.1 phosphatidate cytidylyltransferase [Campylobacter sp. MIT 21-1682]MCX2807990.1 phosphatidate cytidylyltransferase [Campylobacter sp. MIT 21-1685]